VIEIGKQYEIINSMAGNNGLIVTVTGFAGIRVDDVDSFNLYGSRWRVDRYLTTNYGDEINHLGERQLKSLYDGNTKTSWEELKNIWTPLKYKVLQ
jgi:hypothetical protein